MKPPDVVPDAVIDSIAQSYVKFLRQGECPLHDGTWRGLGISLADSLGPIATEGKGNHRPSAGDYNASELWVECNRLARNGSEESMSWLCDILGTLGYEWV